MKAIIQTGGKQYVVLKGDVIDVELLGDKKTFEFDALLVSDDKGTKVGKPTVEGAKVKAKLLEEVRDPKVTSIRYKAKKRVHKKRGHKQKKSRIEITSVTAS